MIRLHQAKIAGHYVVKNSGWFSVARKKTIIAGPTGSGKTTILRALQSINPPTGGGSESPFRDFPQYLQKEGYRRKVIPEKKTAVITVFTCDDALRFDLASIDPVFYETDRIESGRKLDNSRWISFVEISSSSRWSEVAEDMEGLRNFVAKSKHTHNLLEQYDTLVGLKKTERIKGEIADRLDALLSSTEKLLDDSHRDLIQQARFKIHRARRFQEARKRVVKNLPFFIYFSDSFLIRSTIDINDIQTKSHNDTFYMEKDFGNFCLLKTLGLESAKHITSDRDQHHKQLTAMESACATITRDLHSFLPEKSNLNLTVRFTGNNLTVLVKDNDGSETPLGDQDHQVIWLISLLAVLTALTNDKQEHTTILLLDKPGKALSTQHQKQIKKIIDRLADTFQTIYTTQSLAMITKADLNKLRVARFQDETTGTLITEGATMEELASLLERDMTFSELSGKFI